MWAKVKVAASLLLITPGASALQWDDTSPSRPLATILAGVSFSDAQTGEQPFLPLLTPRCH
jgi:hypothetical protein